jgi:uncharacterized membrane protein
MNKQHVLILALLVSLAVNLLIAGMVLGRLGGPRHGPPPMEWAGREMDPQTRTEVRRRLREQQDVFRPMRRDMVAASAAVREALAAEAYDPQVLAAALAEMREVTGRYQQLMHENLVAISADLPREQRLALGQAALQRPENAQLPRRPPAQRR